MRRLIRTESVAKRQRVSDNLVLIENLSTHLHCLPYDLLFVIKEFVPLYWRRPTLAFVETITRDYMTEWLGAQMVASGIICMNKLAATALPSMERDMEGMCLTEKFTNDSLQRFYEFYKADYNPIPGSQEDEVQGFRYSTFKSDQEGQIFANYYPIFESAYQNYYDFEIGNFQIIDVPSLDYKPYIKQRSLNARFSFRLLAFCFFLDDSFY